MKINKLVVMAMNTVTKLNRSDFIRFLHQSQSKSFYAGIQSEGIFVQCI